MKVSSILFLFGSFTLFTSCRSVDSENSLASGSSALKINLLGSSFDDEPPSGKSIGLNGMIDKRVELVDPSTYVLTEVKQEINTFRPLSLGCVNSRALVDGGNLVAGVKFRILVYNNLGNYVIHKDYTVGSLGDDLLLDSGSTYTIVAYSFGTTTLPSISAFEMGRLSTAVVNYDDANRDFMWQSQSYTANGNIKGVLLGSGGGAGVVPGSKKSSGDSVRCIAQ